jgi:hypothetical protein
MSKTVLAASEVAAGLALALTGFGVVALPWALSAGVLAAMGAVGVSAGITGVFGLLQPLLNPNDNSVPGSQQNSAESAAFRRVIYGYMEVGGVLTFDNVPSGSGNFQLNGLNAEWRHQVYTIAGHQISSFGKAGILSVIIDGVPYLLKEVTGGGAGSGGYIPLINNMPYGGHAQYSGLPTHIYFEFDLGSPTETSAFPNLALACPEQWTASCIQAGRAKVHVAMQWDQQADGSLIGGGTNLSVSSPVYVNGRVPSFRFQVTGVPVIDTRTGETAVNPSNPALCIYDYLTNSDYGLGVNPATIDVPSVNAAANICEEQVVVFIGTEG